jgi:UDP-glucose 4-epimerase
VEKYLYYYQVVYDLPSIALRYTNVYGPRQNPHGESGVIAIFCEKMLSGKTPVINGSGAQTRDYVFVGDVVRANLLAIKSEFSGPINIGTSLETDVNALFSIIKDQIAPNIEVVHGEGKKGEQLRSVVDYKKAQNIFGWKPEISLEVGLTKTVDFFRGQR